MADEIYINLGTTIQQPYQGQVPANAQSNETKQIIKQTPASSQTAYRSPSQTPATYRNPVSGQQPLTNVEKQTPFTYQAQSQSPFTYQVTYQHPAIYQHRQPSSSQSPYIANAQTEIANVSKQSPFTYQVQNTQGQQPNIRNKQQPIIYQYQANAQQPIIVRSPFTYQNVGPVSTQEFSLARSPMIYWYQQNIIFEPEQIDVYQGPQNDGYDVIGSKQWHTQVRSPMIRQGYLQPSRTPIPGGPVIAQGQIPFSYNQYSGRAPFIYQHQASSTQQPNTTFVEQNPVNAQQPLPARSPFTYPRQDVSGRSPFTYQHRSPFIYQYPANIRQPIIYQHRQPSTYQNRQPTQQQTPVIANQQTTAQIVKDKQESNPYIGQARQPLIYQTRSPFTYQNPVNRQTATQNIARQPAIYQTPYQVNYQHRSPFIYQTPYSTTRTIGPVAKVKAVYLNDNGNLRKLEEVYVNENSTPEKIHQTVPAARFSKNPSNTQQ